MTKSARASKLYRIRKQRGEPATMPIHLVRARIQDLYDRGLKPQMIADAAGIDIQTVCHIMKRNTQHVRVEIAARIFTVTHIPNPRQTLVLAIGARRRIRALNAIGWSTTDLAHRLSISSNDTLNGSIKRPTITYQRWAAIRDLYEQLSGTPGGNQEALRAARRIKAAPPLAWDGRDIDDPRVQPDWAAAGIKIADRPVCRNGHPRTAENLIRDHRGHRACRICLDEQKQRAAKRRKQAA